MKGKNKIETKIEYLNNVAEKISKIKNVKGIYLFGSQATGNAGGTSDIDICVFGNLNEEERHEVLNYSSNNLDISFFNDLPIMIQFRVFKGGKPLKINNQDYIDKAKIMAVKRYFDFRPVINRYVEEVLGCTT